MQQTGKDCWPSAAAFYQERDNRTMLAITDLAAYAQREIEIVVDPADAASPAVQAMTLLAANLTARWARNVSVCVPAVALHATMRRGQYELLSERVAAEMRAADPFGNFRITETLSTETALRLFIGSFADSPAVSAEDFVIHAKGWSALGRRSKGFPRTIFQPATIAAAGLAASLGVADLFKRAIGHPPQHWLSDFCWSTWSHQLQPQPFVEENVPVPEQLDLGNTLLAGVGAIGSAFLYLADLLPLRGSLTLLDRDCIETSNLNRSPLFTADHAIGALHKTAAGRDYLTWHELDVRTLDGTWREHSAHIAKQPYDVWISLTNEDAAWAEVPFLLPPVVLQATTTSGWGMGAGRHLPRREDCTLCRLPRPAAAFRGPCAQGDIAASRTATPVQAALPFLSAGAAALLLAEYLKLGAPRLLNLPNEVSVDLRLGLPAVMALHRLPQADCRGCAAALIQLWETRGGRGRFRHYSMAA